jgi:valyl-tRNA synthetase
LRVVGYRQFCNKIWNACKFALEYVSDFTPTPTTSIDLINMRGISKRDLYILHRLNETITECDINFKSYLFGNVTTTLHSFFLYDVCDLYLELLKPVFNDNSIENAETKLCAQATLYTVLEQYLRLCHPIMPFVTEELWQRLPNRSGLNAPKSIMIASYPITNKDWIHPDIQTSYESFKTYLNVGRSLRTQYKIGNSTKTNFYYKCTDVNLSTSISDLSYDFCTLCKSNFLKEYDDNTPKGCSIKVIDESLSIMLDLRGAVDIDEEIARLTKDMLRINPLIEQLNKKINSAGYEKVPEKVKEANEAKLTGYNTELANIATAVSEMESIKA